MCVLSAARGSGLRFLHLASALTISVSSPLGVGTASTQAQPTCRGEDLEACQAVRTEASAHAGKDHLLLQLGSAALSQVKRQGSELAQGQEPHSDSTDSATPDQHPPGNVASGDGPALVDLHTSAHTAQGGLHNSTWPWDRWFPRPAPAPAPPAPAPTPAPAPPSAPAPVAPAPTTPSAPALPSDQAPAAPVPAPAPAPAPAPDQPPADEPSPSPAPSSCQACLCVFDIDRTLTGKQGDNSSCPRNRVTDMHDEGYGGGRATLSALVSEGIATTFCNECHLGITSAGSGSGAGSRWNDYLLYQVMSGAVHDAFMQAHPESRRWSYGTDVDSPFVLNQGNKVKQNSVDLIRQWFGRSENGVCIQPENVYFFGDRTENIEPFGSKGINSREISCGSRDPDLYDGSGMVGYCGATPEEVQKVQGNILCN